MYLLINEARYSSVIKSCFNHIYRIIYMNKKENFMYLQFFVPKAQVYMYRENIPVHVFWPNYTLDWL